MVSPVLTLLYQHLIPPRPSPSGLPPRKTRNSLAASQNGFLRLPSPSTARSRRVSLDCLAPENVQAPMLAPTLPTDLVRLLPECKLKCHAKRFFAQKSDRRETTVLLVVLFLLRSLVVFGPIAAFLSHRRVKAMGTALPWVWYCNTLESRK